VFVCLQARANGKRAECGHVKKGSKPKKQRSIWKEIYEESYTTEDGHVVKDSENQNTIKLYADGSITCNNH
jgi:hypothetical protein